MYTADLLEEDFRITRRLTRKEKRQLRSKNKQPTKQEEQLNFNLKTIEPLTYNQELTFDAYEDGKNLLLHGFPGTGKTFIAMYLALNELLKDQNTIYKKLIIVRSTVSTRDSGFLPGNDKDKIKVYEPPYQDICRRLFSRGDAYSYLKNKGLIEFISTAFIRGITVDNAIILVDEIENLTIHELDSIITRVGKNCKIMFCGDFRQSDFIYDKDKKGLKEFMNILIDMKDFEFIDFKKEDIVRSGLVKAYILSKIKLEDRKRNDQINNTGLLDEQPCLC